MLKLLGLSKYFFDVQANATEDNKRLKQDLNSVAQTFAKIFFNLAESLLKNLPNYPKKFYKFCSPILQRYRTKR